MGNIMETPILSGSHLNVTLGNHKILNDVSVSFQAGVMQMDVWFVTTKLVLPVVVTQLHLLCIPYTLCSALPYLGNLEPL